LTHQELERLLGRRFAHHNEKLSDIPHPSQLKDALKGAKRMADAIRAGEKIAVVGDYDVDGVTSTAIVKRFFSLISYPLLATIPNRFTDGYGVSKGVLERIDADVVFTVDNGIESLCTHFQYNRYLLKSFIIAAGWNLNRCTDLAYIKGR
jgi:single-stranded-DNA-specific exonuclease